MTTYVTGAQLAVYVGLTGTDTRCDQAVAAASRAIDQVCGRRFYADTSTSARVFRSNDAVILNVDDIADTTGMTVLSDSDNDGTFETTWTSSQYTLEPLNNVNGGIEGWPYYKLVSVWPKFWPWFYWQQLPQYARRPNVQITAKWGWPAVPDAIVQAAYITGADLWKRKDAPFGVAGFGDLGVMRIKSDPTLVGPNGLLTPYIKTIGLG